MVRSLRSVMMGAVSVVAVVQGAPAAAQSLDARGNFDIAAQPVGDALLQFSRQSRVQIVSSAAQLGEARSKPVKGEMTARQALSTLLGGTGLVFRPIGSGSVAIAPDAKPVARGGRGTIAGSLNEATTGAALKGARVEIEETGDVASTDDLGNFRFANVPAGDVTLRVSYLGYPATSMVVTVSPSETASAPITLAAGQDREIIVRGQVSARAQALNQERTGENSRTIVSGDLLGNFNGTTVSDALRRAPGVSFLQEASTGDGSNIVVRGLAPDYNQVKINGVALPESTGTGRSPSLRNILADSISEIRISKTLTAAQESYGTGGLVEIETKSPLDRPKHYFNVSVDGLRRAKGFGNEYSVSGTASMRFGADGNFGLSASYQRREQESRTYQYTLDGVYGAYIGLRPDGQPGLTRDMDPRVAFPFYPGAEYYVQNVAAAYNLAEVETSTLSLSAEWQVSQGTNLRIDYVRATRDSDTLGNSSSVGGVASGYSLLAVPAEGGASRYVYGYGLPIVSALNGITLNRGGEQQSDTLSFRGESAFGGLRLNYQAGYAKAAQVSAESHNFSLGRSFSATAADLLPEAVTSATGTVVSYFGPRVGRGMPQPLLTSAGFEKLANQGLYVPAANSAFNRRGSSEDFSGAFSAKYDFSAGWLKYVETGLQYKGAKFRNVGTNNAYYSLNFGYSPLPTYKEMGLEYETVPFDSVTNGDTAYLLIDEASVNRFVDSLDALADKGYFTRRSEGVDPLLAQVYTDESALAGYIQLKADIGRFEIIPGVRIDRNRVEAGFANGTSITREDGSFDQQYYDQSRVIQTGADVLTTVLPRVLVNFRPSNDLVFRAGYFSTVARPQITQLNSSRSIQYDARRRYGSGTQPRLMVSEGNPALKPATTHNFDLSGEWYDQKVGVVKLGVFYKQISNMIESNERSMRGVGLEGIDLPDHPLLNAIPSDVFVQLSRPENSPDSARIWGVEAAFEKRLTFLPGPLSGLGVYLNYTYTNSERTYRSTWVQPIYDPTGVRIRNDTITYTRRVPFTSSPRHSGTVGLTYTGYGVDASLYYTRQARVMTGVGIYQMDIFDEAVASLDFRAVYNFKFAGSVMRFSVEANNLLQGKSDPLIERTVGGSNGTPKYYTSGTYHGGRRFGLGLSATF
ncbi:TonB-dependent receptor [Sphingomonas colocasiae]|uniref:TonB-dependent receptor n=1 Tax=Sphingomonas colocasiae TaxID=1848973 RepID=A0ABS7PPP6_9SPHN|nr:TonB-dependent receptor [Sphingomonas colocasiae]MBY8823243.1 TonB-dependent receptor [Sphingomonas colocasiae]